MATGKIDTGTEELLCEVQDGVAVITLNRPRRGMRCQTTCRRHCAG